MFPLVSVATSVSILTACLNELCLEAKTDLHCLEHSELLFHVSVSNLHLPQMKFSERSMPLDYGILCTPLLIPNLARLFFSC